MGWLEPTTSVWYSSRHGMNRTATTAARSEFALWYRQVVVVAMASKLSLHRGFASRATERQIDASMSHP